MKELKKVSKQVTALKMIEVYEDTKHKLKKQADDRKMTLRAYMQMLAEEKE